MSVPGTAGGTPHYIVPPMFAIPSVTWSSAPGASAVGKFPNPKSVFKICKLLTTHYYFIILVPVLTSHV